MRLKTNSLSRYTPPNGGRAAHLSSMTTCPIDGKRWGLRWTVLGQEGTNRAQAGGKGDNLTIRTFAEKHRLKISRDECGDEIIQGRRGHLYFDAGELCLMVTDGKRAKKSQWEALNGALLWLGDISQGVQDVSIKGIPLDNAKLAIRMCQTKRKRLMSEAQKAVLAKAQDSSPLHARLTRRSLESLAGRSVKELGGPAK